jgi:hypothetical protein
MNRIPLNPSATARSAILGILCILPAAWAQPASVNIADGPVPIQVLAESPAETATDLQVICLFRSSPENIFHGSLAEMNEKLKGVLDLIRRPDRFRGELGETLLITPVPGSIPAKRLLIIGLGDSKTFTGRAGRRDTGIAASHPQPPAGERAGRSIPRIARLMALAIRFDGLLREETIGDYAELARLGQSPCTELI